MRKQLIEPRMEYNNDKGEQNTKNIKSVTLEEAEGGCRDLLPTVVDSPAAPQTGPEAWPSREHNDIHMITVLPRLILTDQNTPTVS